MFPEDLSRALDSLVIFRHLLSDPLIAAAKDLADCFDGGESRDKVRAYGAFARALYQRGGCLADCVSDLLAEDDNLYVRQKAAGKPIAAYMESAMAEELRIFSALASLDAQQIAARIDYGGRLAGWETGFRDIEGEYRWRMERLCEVGYGIFAKYRSFIVRDGVLTPVKHPDKISLADLKDYEQERQKVIDNTEALVSGKPALNVLLAGDAGTGKSSTVKAVANHFADRGVRLVQITKNQLHDLPLLTDELSANPLKFIIFIDDLSFSSNDDDFGALKAALEGAVSAKAENTVIYVTSNRRHLVKENFRDRAGDDLHHNDTLQEITSLSDRFGLTVTYSKPGKKIFLDIVCALADQNHLIYDREALCAEAETFALRKGGRSPRAAKQFIDSIAAKQG